MEQIARPEADYGGKYAVETFIALGMEYDKKEKALEIVKLDMDFCEAEIKRLNGPSFFRRFLVLVANFFECLGCTRTSNSIRARITSYNAKAKIRLLGARQDLEKFQEYIDTLSQSTGKVVRSAFAAL